ncbi:Sperm motility kinase X [Sciurus carolinensis]|uniref:non-specific serine/threonine protein kinase n=1 Tax=Sciurus carolinensis TaxID=30640 RepID=A0AA41MZR7_SCICA|nr:Sperm motility kinase X [Sciurus carolinensis]
MRRECSESSVEAQGPGSCFESALTDHYCVLRPIGEGSFSQVVLARHLLTGVKVAVKVVPKTEGHEPVLREREWLMSLEHANVIQLFQVIETPRNMYLVMEYAEGGQLRLRIPREGGLPEVKVRRAFREMVQVVHYCHQKGVAHLDLKPENFVVDARGHVKLIDFGLSTSIAPGQLLTGFRGTLLYLAPEIIQRKGFEGPPADVWSLGVTLYFMLTGRRPFMASTSKGLQNLVLQASYDIPPHVSPGARSLIQQLLTVDPTQRPTLEQVMGHPWLSQGQDPSPSRPSQPLPQRLDPAIMTVIECSESSVEAQGPGSCFESALTDHYCVLRPIGEGSFSQVVLARHLLTGVKVAVKVVPKTEGHEPVLREREWLMSLEHANVIQLFQVIETPRNMYLVMEYAEGGQLRLRIPREGGLPEVKVRRAFREMVQVVHYCHQKGVAHLDLKPENFVVDARGHVKLIDFGLSTSIAPGQLLTGFRGTLLYLAPEIIQRKGFEGPPADVWSLGVTLYFMLTGRRPFMASTSKGLQNLVLQASYDIPPHVSPGARSLIQQLLTVDPTQRPTLEQVMGHPWLSQGQDPSPTRPSQPLPQRLDPAIMTVMFDMGFDPYNTWLSLANRQFDEAMATYLLLQHQRSQGAGCPLQAKPVRRRVVQDPSPSRPSQPLPQRLDPAIMTVMFDMGFDPYNTWLSLANRQFDEAMATYLLLQHQRSQGAGCPLQAKPVRRRVVGPRPGPSVDPPSVHPNRCTSEPALLLPHEPQQPEEAKPSGRKDAACASVPAIPLRFLHEKMPAPRPASRQDSGPSPGRQGAEGGSSASQGTSTGPAHDRGRGWRRVTRRIAACLRRLCCCLPCVHGPASRRRVAPADGGHRPPRLPNSVVPEIVPT